MTAVCIQCGTKKKEAWYKCRKCGLTPTGKDLVKSVYCSTGRFQDPDDQDRYEVELEKIANKLKSGKAIKYNDQELERLAHQQKDIGSVPASAVWSAVFRFFVPGVIFLAVLYFLLWMLKR